MKSGEILQRRVEICFKGMSRYKYRRTRELLEEDSEFGKDGDEFDFEGRMDDFRAGEIVVGEVSEHTYQKLLKLGVLV